MGETQKKEKKKIGLTTKIFIALLAGAVFGIILCYAVPSGHIKDDIIVEGVLYVVGQGFIKLMKMLVVPLVFCSLVCGSMSIGDTKKLGTVGARTLIFYLATTALAVTVALSVGNLINPGVGLDMSTIKTNAASVETMKATSLTDTLLNIIPDNPINSLASGEMLQIIVFALIIGVILAKLGERAETVANFFSQFNDGNDDDDHGTCPNWCLLPDQPHICKHRIQCICTAGKIYDRCVDRTGNPVFRCIPDLTEDIYRTESSEIYQEVLPGYGLRILNSNIKCNDSAVNRYPVQEGGCI